MRHGPSPRGAAYTAGVPPVRAGGSFKSIPCFEAVFRRPGGSYSRYGQPDHQRLPGMLDGSAVLHAAEGGQLPARPGSAFGAASLPVPSHFRTPRHHRGIHPDPRQQGHGLRKTEVGLLRCLEGQRLRGTFEDQHEKDPPRDHRRPRCLRKTQPEGLRAAEAGHPGGTQARCMRKDRLGQRHTVMAYRRRFRGHPRPRVSHRHSGEQHGFPLPSPRKCQGNRSGTYRKTLRQHLDALRKNLVRKGRQGTRTCR